MKRLLSALAYIFSAAGLAVLFLLPSNRYDWMREVDPEMSTLPTDQAADERQLFTILLVALMVIVLAVLAAKEHGRLRKAVPLVLAAVAVLLWFTKFF